MVYDCRISLRMEDILINMTDEWTLKGKQHVEFSEDGVVAYYENEVIDMLRTKLIEDFYDVDVWLDSYEVDKAIKIINKRFGVE